MMKPKVGGQQPFFVIKEGRCFCFGGGGNKNNPQPADRPLKSPDAASVNVPPKTAEVSEKTAVRLGILTDGCRLSPSQDASMTSHV